jgi:hypothetical protein
MARLIHGTEIIEDTWHPLDNVPAPEYIPPCWIGPHVGLRLVDAFKTLSRMPPPRVNMQSGIWPRYRHDWEDLLAQVQGDADVKAEDARAQNRARLLPTAEDISRMERAIVWPGRYLGTRPRIARLVQRVAMFRARDFDLDTIAKRMRRPPELIRYCNRSGLEGIATGLRRDAAIVF